MQAGKLLVYLCGLLHQGWHWKDGDTQREDLAHIIAIHNKNNEEAWQEVLKWELMHAQ